MLVVRLRCDKSPSTAMFPFQSQIDFWCVSNIDQKCCVSSAHADDITALPAATWATE